MNVYINRVEELSDEEKRIVVRNLVQIHRDLTDELSKKTCEMLINIVKAKMGLNEEIYKYRKNKFMHESCELLGIGEQEKREEMQYGFAELSMRSSGFHIGYFVNALYLLEDITGKNALEGVQSLKYYAKKDEIFRCIEIENNNKTRIEMSFGFQKLIDSFAKNYRFRVAF